MPQTVILARAEDIAPRTGIETAAAGRMFAIFNVDGEFHVLDGVCPHAGGPLGQGSLNGSVVTCPWHGWQFDVTTGTHCLNDRICHTRYPARVVDGDVVVEIDDEGQAARDMG